MNLQEAAQRLGVHYQTAYRWVRDGDLTALKHGMAYEVTEEEVERFLRLRLVPTAPPDRLSVRSWTSHRERLTAALLAGEELDARGLVDRLVDGNVAVIELCEQLIAPCLAEIGDRWHRGETSVAEEHRATAICDRLLGRIATHPRGRPRGTALVLAAPGDDHAFASSLAAVALRDDKWRVHHLGSNVPTADLLAMAKEIEADIIVLSVTFAKNSDARKLADMLEAQGFPVLIGGVDGKTLTDLVLAARKRHRSTPSHTENHDDN